MKTKSAIVEYRLDLVGHFLDGTEDDWAGKAQEASLDRSDGRWYEAMLQATHGRGDHGPPNILSIRIRVRKQCSLLPNDLLAVMVFLAFHHFSRVTLFLPGAWFMVPV